MASPKFTCISCRVAFSTAEIQRQHYKTDWHRYNLKRKVVQLGPVSAEQFQAKVLEQRHKESQEAQNGSVFCRACRRAFATGNAFQNHLGSKKHREAEAAMRLTDDSEDIAQPIVPSETSPLSDNEEMEEVDSDEWDLDSDEVSPNNPILNKDCLFCENHSKTLTKCVRHMTESHSFFVPDIDYLVDLRGLLLYLGEKVIRIHACLWCNRCFNSTEAVQGHMKDKGHCKMLHEGEALAQYHMFYNYATSYPDHESSMDVDQEVTIPDVIDDLDYELTLPSGATIGHRSLVVYYRQNLNSSQEIVIKKPKQRDQIISTYRSLGWTDTDRETARRKERDIQFIRRVQMKYATKLGVKANKLQKHFRPQVNF